MHGLITALVVIFFGVLVLGFSLRKPRIKSLVGSDLITIIAAGMCLGAGLILLVRAIAL